MSRRDADGGNAAVAFALWLPIVLLALASCVQLAASLYDARAVAEAARVAVRAERAGSDPAPAARSALPGRDGVSVRTDAGRVQVILPVRQVVPWLPESLRTVTGTAGDRP